MGDWAIVVHGTGAHHNQDYPNDADRLAQRFVDDLIRVGHQVHLATFTAGGRTVLDTIDNLSAQRATAARTSDAEAWNATDTAKRIEGLQAVGLSPSKRREPLATSEPL